MTDQEMLMMGFLPQAVKLTNLGNVMVGGDASTIFETVMTKEIIESLVQTYVSTAMTEMKELHKEEMEAAAKRSKEDKEAAVKLAKEAILNVKKMLEKRRKPR